MSDPRQHRDVDSVDDDVIAYLCGCWNKVAPPFGVLRRLSTCRHHAPFVRDPETLDEAYYRELGALDADAPARYMAELTEALGPFPCAGPGLPEWALEVGCGVSPYAGDLRACGYRYAIIEPSRWAAARMRAEAQATFVAARIERVATTVLEGAFALILAAHVIEHVDEAPAAIVKLGGWLRPGGEIRIIVPDDSDPVNPDHTFFFDEDSLRRCVEASGLAVERLVVRRYVKHERFLYLRARKPI